MDMKKLRARIVVFLLLFSSLAFTSIPIVHAPSYIFESDMDSADFSDWDYNQNVTRITDPVANGTYSANFTNYEGSLIREGFTETNPVYVQFYIRFSGLPNGINVSRWMLYVETENEDVIALILYNDGGSPRNCVFAFYSYALDDFQTGTTPLSSDTWYNIQIRAEQNASTDCTLWINESEECSITGDNSGSEGFNRTHFNIGDGMNFGEFDRAYLDHVIIDDEYIMYVEPEAPWDLSPAIIFGIGFIGIGMVFSSWIIAHDRWKSGDPGSAIGIWMALFFIGICLSTVMFGG